MGLHSFLINALAKAGYFFYPDAALGPKQLKEIYHSPAAQRPGGELGDVV